MKYKILKKMPVPNMKKLTFANKKVPRKLFSDSDGDGYANPIDCQPFNSRKQDIEIEYGEGKSFKVGEKLKGFAGRVREKYRSYKAKAPERRKKRLEEEEYKTKLAGEREKRSQLRHTAATRRLGLAEKRTASMQKRQRAMGAMPSMFGTQTKQPSLMTPFSTTPTTKKRKVKRRKIKKRTSKKSKYIMIGGKAYERG